MSREATLLVYDEFTYSLAGKTSIFGIYSSDIQIPTDPTHANQLIFLFSIETDPTDLFQQLELRVDLPGGDARQMVVPLPALRPSISDSVRWSVKYPLLFQNPILKPGPILAAVFHEKGTIFPAAPFISLRVPLQQPVSHSQ